MLPMSEIHRRRAEPPIRQPSNTEFYFYIRGHIRNSFQTDRLKRFIQLVLTNFPNVIFILQTWNSSECNHGESWRKNLQTNIMKIDKTTLDLYFENPKITSRSVIIDPNTIEYVGDVKGNVCKSYCPKKGWKNMWYGLYKGIENIPHSDINKILVSFRFDYFELPNTQVFYEHSDENSIIKFIHNNLNIPDIRFIKGNNTVGVDNLYMGSVKNVKTLIEKFHFELDYILSLYPEQRNQECLVPKITNSLRSQHKN